jgi:hypothetical protein
MVEFTCAQAGICRFCSYDLWNLCGFSIEEELLCEAQSCYRNFVPQSVEFYISINHLSRACKRKEVNSYKNCPGQARNLVKVEDVIDRFF